MAGFRRRVSDPPRGLSTALVVLVLSCMAAGAFAQTMDPGLFSQEDGATRSILAFLKLDDMASGLGDMLFVYNSGVVVLAGTLLVYQCVAGTVDTARHGRWGFGGWQIVRIVVAVALMAPLPGGLNGAQHIVLSLAHLGGDFAHAVWQPVTRNLASARPVRPEAGEHARRTALARILVAETCRHVANAGGLALIAVETEASDRTHTRRYAGVGSDMPRQLCGAITYGLHAPSDGWSPGAIMPAPPQDSDATSAAVRELAEAHRRAVERLMPTIEAMAAELARHFDPSSAAYGQPLPEANTWLGARGLARHYRADIEAALDRAARRHEAAMDGLTRDWQGPQSWLWAGSAFNTLAWQTGRFQAAARNVPRVGLPAENLERWSPAAAGAVESVLAWLARSQMPARVASPATGDAPASAGDAPDEIVSHLFDVISFDVTMVATGDNPVVDLASFGHELIAAALSAIAVLTGASAGSNLLESVPVVGPGLDAFESVWNVADGFVTLFLGVLLISGVTLAYVLPMLPFIRFLFGILAWLIAVVEAVLAVTIFAAFHISREEADRLIATTTRQGWLFLPRIVLTPPLMVLGLVLGTFIFLAAMEILNALWVPQMQRAQASGLADPVGFLAMLVLYTLIAWTLMNSAFRLIDAMPHVVLRWIGAAGSPDDDGAGRVTALATGSVGRLASIRLPHLARR